MTTPVGVPDAVVTHQCFEDEEAMQRIISEYRTMKNNPQLRLVSAMKLICVPLLSAGLLALCSCSSSVASKPQVNGITFTDIDGTALKSQPTTLTIGQGSYVSTMLSNDPKLLGASWSVACGSALPPGTPLPPGQTQDVSCGTFTPAHTLSGPIPTYVTNAASSGYLALYVAPPAPPAQGTVTLYASATADHSQVATVTLTIQGQPITVGFAPMPASTLQAGASTQLRVVLNNDVMSAGVRWSVLCGSMSCGYFGPVETDSGVATTYVAPAVIPPGGNVQIFATSIADPTKSVTTTLAITQ